MKLGRIDKITRLNLMVVARDELVISKSFKLITRSL